MTPDLSRNIASMIYAYSGKSSADYKLLEEFKSWLYANYGDLNSLDNIPEKFKPIIRTEER